MGLILFQAGYTKFFIWKLPTVINNFEGMDILFPQATGPFTSALGLAGGAALSLGLVFAAQFCVAAHVVAVGFGKGVGGASLGILLIVIALLLATNGGGALPLGAILRK